jgi:hypothetical protein
MSDQRCLYPGCEEPVVPHPAGGPPSAFCDDERHNALSAHQERERLAAAGATDSDPREGRPSHG